MLDFRVTRNIERLEHLNNLRDIYNNLNEEYKDKTIVNKMEFQSKVDHITNSNAIEGNTMTYWETEMLLEKGVTINGKSVREHTETINLSIAYDMIMKLIGTKGIIKENEILNIHRLITQGLIENRLSGKYRDCNVRIGRSQHIPPNHQEVPKLMKGLVNWYNREYIKGNYTPEEIAIAFKYYFVNIHPFADGNGRASRLWLNILLLRERYTPIVIESKTKLDYYIELEYAGQKRDLSNFNEFIYNQIEHSLTQYITLFKQ